MKIRMPTTNPHYMIGLTQSNKKKIIIIPTRDKIVMESKKK